VEKFLPGQKKAGILDIECSVKILEKASHQPVMILTDEILKQSPDTRLVAIYNSYEDGTSVPMNFELSNGYVTK
jgi:hypothetical protein